MHLTYFRMPGSPEKGSEGAGFEPRFFHLATSWYNVVKQHSCHKYNIICQAEDFFSLKISDFKYAWLSREIMTVTYGRKWLR